MLMPGADFGPILDRPEEILDRIWADVGRFWDDFWLNFDRIEEASSKLSSATRMLDFLDNSRENQGFAALFPGRC